MNPLLVLVMIWFMVGCFAGAFPLIGPIILGMVFYQVHPRNAWLVSARLAFGVTAALGLYFTARLVREAGGYAYLQLILLVATVAACWLSDWCRDKYEEWRIQQRRDEDES